MGKHRLHRGFAAISPTNTAQVEHQRQLADPGDHRTVEPDTDAADQLPSRERALRLSVHTDRHPVEDFHLAAKSPGQDEDE